MEPVLTTMKNFSSSKETKESLENSKTTEKEVEVYKSPKKDESNAIMNLLCGCLGIKDSVAE